MMRFGFGVHSVRLAFCTLLTVFGGGRVWSTSPLLSQLRMEQKIEKVDQLYSVTPALNISFTLAEPADVTVTIARHLAGYEEFKWPYLAEPFPVRTLEVWASWRPGRTRWIGMGLMRTDSRLSRCRM